MRRWILIAFAIAILGVVVAYRAPWKRSAAEPTDAATAPSAPSEPALTNANPATPPVAVPAQPNPREWIEEAMRGFKKGGEQEYDRDVAALVAKLKAAGPRGVHAVSQFLRSGEDHVFRDGVGFAGPRMTKPATFRGALIAAMDEWPGTAPVLMAVLLAPKSSMEITLAIRGLEAQFPGAYRHDALGAVTKYIRQSGATADPQNEAFVYPVVRHFRAVEVLPEVTEWVAQAPADRLLPFARALTEFEDPVQRASVESLLGKPAVAETIYDSPQLFGQLPYAGEAWRNTATFAFTQRWTPEQRLIALESMKQSARPASDDWFLRPARGEESLRKERELAVAEVKARKAVLAEIAPAADSPELQAALKAARAAVGEEAVALEADWRAPSVTPEEVSFASGEGRAVIKGRRIEAIELQKNDLGSTPQPPAQ